MAITHFTPRLVSRGNGRSVVAAAAYRHCSRMLHEREGRTIDYSRKSGLVHEEFVLPPGAPRWAVTQVVERSVAAAAEAFWNRVERFEKRADAQLAKEFLLALPKEFDLDQNIALVRDFVAQEISPRGLVADWVLHHPPGNPHVHLLTSLRPLTDAGFGNKKVPVLLADGSIQRDSSGRPLYRLWAGGRQDFLNQRQAWLDLINLHLLQNGYDLRVDGRSYGERGIPLEATLHVGVGAKALAERGGASARVVAAQRQRQRLAARVQASPGLIIQALAQQQSVFDRRDMARWLHRYLDLEAACFESTLTAVLADPDLVCLQHQSIDEATGAPIPAQFSTRHLVKLEGDMVSDARRLGIRRDFACSPRSIEVTLGGSTLSSEQQAAVRHVCGPQAVAVVVGRAGAGKTTMMTAARHIWESTGFRVIGGALAGKAAEGLTTESGIASRTLASWELSWGKGQALLDHRTIFVLDEAGMVSSSQMAQLVKRVRTAGAKLVMVGDPDQLQPIAAGAAFRALIAEIGYAELQTIYRQHLPWMRDASTALARGNVGEAIAAYRRHGMISTSRTRGQAMKALVQDWVSSREAARSSLILAHRRADVETLNTLVREALQACGALGDGHVFPTTLGQRRFAPGDQVVFLRNDRRTGVKNGLIGHVTQAAPGRLTVTVGSGSHQRTIDVESHRYEDIDHGYATTIHKAQGATVDQVHVLATAGLDRHLTYVALTRHRMHLKIFHGAAEFRRAGGLIAALSRPNPKLTTRDFVDSVHYDAAWRYATNRGLHAMRVARTLLDGHRQWLTRQGQRLARAVPRLKASIGLPRAAAKPDTKPLFPAMISQDQVVGQEALARLPGDPGVARALQRLGERCDLVFADPSAALQSLDPIRCLHDPGWQAKADLRLQDPASIATLRNERRLWPFAERHTSDLANNVEALRDEFALFVRVGKAAFARLQQQQAHELAARKTVVPNLSPAAAAILQSWASPSQLDKTTIANIADGLRCEILAFAAASEARFGPLCAMDKPALPYPTLAARVGREEREKLVRLLPTLKAAQQLSGLWRSLAPVQAAGAKRTLRQ